MSPPTPTKLKNEMLVELALMQEYTILTTFLFNTYLSSIPAQSKPNGKLRVLVSHVESTYWLNTILENTRGDILKRSTAHGWEEVLLQTRLLPSVSLHTDDRWPVRRVAFHPFCIQIFCLQTCSSWFKLDFISITRVIRECLDPAVKWDCCARM